MRATRAFSIVLISAAAACRDSGTEVPAPIDLVTSDVAVVAGDAAYEDVGMIYTQVGAFGVPTGDPGRTGGWVGPCPYDAETGRFTCPPITINGRTMSRSYAFRDASGAAQTAYDASTTESANFRSTFSGSVAREGWNATISHQRDMTLSGLAGTETHHTINGTGSSTHTRSEHTVGGTRTYSMASVATFTNVVVPVPRSRGAWPVSGSITRQVTATRDGGDAPVTHTRTTTTIFNGTRFATLVVGDRQFTLDLATGRVVRGQ